MSVDRVENCKVDDIASGELHRCFIEMSACVGSCANGPIMQKHHNTPLRNYRSIVRSAGKEDFDMVQPPPELLSCEYSGAARSDRLPDETEIAEILKKMGKTKPEDELNCGTCGYNTCREKAVAGLPGQGRDKHVLPYLMKSRSASQQHSRTTRPTASWW